MKVPVQASTPFLSMERNIAANTSSKSMTLQSTNNVMERKSIMGLQLHAAKIQTLIIALVRLAERDIPLLIKLGIK